MLEEQKPWPKPSADQCYWYHTMAFPNETIRGSWTIPDFPNYIGGYDLQGKTVLDVGSASGYLAFNAEKAGASVTGLDARTTDEFRHVPFSDSLSYTDLAASRRAWTDGNLIPVKNSWWYGWHALGSRAKCIYAPHEELYQCETQFDIVMAGAIVIHLSDPIYAIGAWARAAKEAVLIPYTDIIPTQELLMRPVMPWTDTRFYFAWWALSEGLWRQLFDQLGFDFEWKMATAIHNDDPLGPQTAHKPSIIARRR
jgi:SAM-dependent methyltransferase